MASKLSLFLAEVKRRKVTRVAVVYVLVGLGAIEAVDIIGDRLLFPEWAIQFVIVLVLIGFPIALVLAWALEVTPQGIQKTGDLTPEQLASETPEKWRASSWILAGVVLVAVLGAGYFVFFRDAEPELTGNLVAVLPFENESGDENLDALGSMAADQISGDVSGSELISGMAEVVPFQRVRSLTSTLAGSDPLQAIADATGAGTVISGRYYLEGETLLIQAEITAVDQGRTLESLQIRKPIGNQTEALEDLRERVTGALAFQFLAQTDDWDEWEIQDPPKHSALLSLLTATELGNASNRREAIEHYRRAFELDSTLVEARLYAAVNFSNLGDRVAADSVLDLIEPHRAALSAENQIFLDLRRSQARLGRQDELRLSIRLRDLHPESPFLRYNVGLNSMRMNRLREAVENLAPLVEIQWQTPWRFPWVHLIRSLHMLGEFDEALDAARRAGEVFSDDGTFHLERIKALAALGREEEVNRLLDERLSFPAGTPGTAMRTAALEFRAHGYPDEARRALDRALSWFENRPTEEAVTMARRRAVAYTLFLAERYTESKTIYEDLFSENPEHVNHLWGLGAIAALEGNREEALRMSQALAALDDPTLRGSNTFERGCIAALLGEKEQAVNLLREAHREGMNFSHTWHVATEFEGLRGFVPFEDFMRPKD